MASPKTAVRLEAERLCKEFPNVASRTLAKRLAKDFKCTIEQGRNMMRCIRGAYGKSHRSESTIAKARGKSGWKPSPPPKSLADPWTPFVIDGCKRVGVISDVHIPYHSDIAFPVAVKELKRRKIDCLLINGDFADFYTISRHQKNPAKRDFRMERGLIAEGLAYLKGEFPKARIVYKYGNHEERWEHYLWNHAAEICDMETIQMSHWLEFERLGIEHVEDQRPVMVGKLPVMHGHELGKGITSPVNPARGAFMRTIHTVLVGHHHRTSQHVEGDMWHDETAIWSTGCLCDMNPEYARVNKWNYGFACAEVDSKGSFNVDNMRISKAGVVRTS